MSRIVSFIVLVAILVVIAAVFFRVMAGFFVPLFLAALIGVVIQPFYRWILAKCRGYRYPAAGITTTLVLLIVLLPISLGITKATIEGMSLLDRLQLQDVQQRFDELRQRGGLIIPQKEDLRAIEARLKHWRGQQRLGVTPNFSQEAVNNLLERLDSIDAWMARQEKNRPAADTTRLREQLIALRNSPPDSLARDRALSFADAEFREFKRAFLGGTYRAWLAESANPTDDQIDQIRRSTLSTAGAVVSYGGESLVVVGKLIFGVIIMVAALFFLLAEGSKMLDALVRISPLQEHYVRELVVEFDRACRAIVSATLLSAVAQGILAGIGFYVAGYFVPGLQDAVALLMLLTMVLALVPFTGAAAVWVPVCLYIFFFDGDLPVSIALAIYGVGIISASDNFIKPYVLAGQSNLHPLLALLSVLGGIQALGPIGILVGPMVVVFLQVLLRLLQRELTSMDKSAWTSWPGFAALARAIPTPTAAGEAARAAASEPAPSEPPASKPDDASTGNGSPPATGPDKPAGGEQPKKRKK